MKKTIKRSKRRTRRATRLTFEEKIRRACILAARTVHQEYADEGRKLPIWDKDRVVYVEPTEHLKPKPRWMRDWT